MNHTATAKMIWHIENEPVEGQWDNLKEATELLMKEQLHDAFKAGIRFAYLLATDAVQAMDTDFETYYCQTYNNQANDLH